MLYGIGFQDDRRPAGVDPARIGFAEGPHLLPRFAPCT
jgi:hypothetical protein